LADPAVSPQHGAGAAATAAASSTAAAVAGSGAPLTKAIVLAGVAFVLGGVAGAGLSSGLHAQRPAVLAPHAPRLVVTVSVVAPAEGPSPLPGASEIQPQATAAPTHASVPAPVRSASSATKGGLAEERALLEAARRAIKAGDVADAFRGLDEHARRFPGGQLGEEREALRVQALVRAGDRSEARRRAEAFRARFPDSAFNPAIDSALGADR
jgi:TolA-binding protein